MNQRTNVPTYQRTEVGGVLVIDKPSGPTSHDVVARVRRLIRAGKVGHLGTLDPAATGVLPLAVGGAARRARELSGTEKVYEFTLYLGAATDTDDAAGRVIAEAPVPADAPAQLAQLLPQFTGTILQRPPAYSAVKVGGMRAYALARKNCPVSLEPRPVVIDSIEILPTDEERPFDLTILRSHEQRAFRLRMACRSGTYVRSLCRDLGEAMGSRGYASGIRRMKSGAYTIDMAIPLAVLELTPGIWKEKLIAG